MRGRFLELLVAAVILPAGAVTADPCLDHLIPYEVAREMEIGQWHARVDSDSGGSLLYFGASHLDDPQAPMFEEIRAEWEAFEPTLAFFEGPDRGIRESAEETIRAFGESGYVRHLAAEAAIPARSLEPSPVDEYRALAQLFPEDQIQLFYIAREAVRLRDRKGLEGEALEDAMNQLIAKVRALFGDVALMSDVDDLADLYERHFGSREWWTADTKWFDPGRTSAETGGIFTNEINRQSSQYRDSHMARLLGEAIRNGERVMAVVGRNHVPNQKGAIECYAQSE